MKQSCKSDKCNDKKLLKSNRNVQCHTFHATTFTAHHVYVDMNVFT